MPGGSVPRAHTLGCPPAGARPQERHPLTLYPGASLTLSAGQILPTEERELEGRPRSGFPSSFSLKQPWGEGGGEVLNHRRMKDSLGQASSPPGLLVSVRVCRGAGGPQAGPHPAQQVGREGTRETSPEQPSANFKCPYGS